MNLTKKQQIHNSVLKHIDNVIDNLNSIEFSSIKYWDTFFNVQKYKLRFDEQSSSINCNGRGFSFYIRNNYIEFDKDFQTSSISNYDYEGYLDFSIIKSEEEYFQYSTLLDFGEFDFVTLQKCFHLRDSIESFFYSDETTILAWKKKNNLL